MNHTARRFTFASAMLIAGSILVYQKSPNINRSFRRMANKQARRWKHRAADAVESARDVAAEKVLQAVGAGKAVFQRVGNRVAERIAGK